MHFLSISESLRNFSKKKKKRNACSFILIGIFFGYKIFSHLGFIVASEGQHCNLKFQEEYCDTCGKISPKQYFFLVKIVLICDDFS